jgi:hypothetical protein
MSAIRVSGKDRNADQNADRNADLRAAVRGRRIEAVVIGASAGGVEALVALLPALPEDFALPVFCILHLPGDRESRLAELFDDRLPLPVREAADKESIEPGTVYFAGSGYHLSVEKDRTFSLSCEPPIHFARPAIDVLMESAADAYGPCRRPRRHPADRRQPRRGRRHGPDPRVRRLHGGAGPRGCPGPDHAAPRHRRLPTQSDFAPAAHLYPVAHVGDE